MPALAMITYFEKDVLKKHILLRDLELITN